MIIFLECHPVCEHGMKCNPSTLQCVHEGMATAQSVLYVYAYFIQIVFIPPPPPPMLRYFMLY